MLSPELFEGEYQRMKLAGIDSWFQRTRPWAIDPHDRHFMDDLLAQEWAPREGSVVEFGCGTGPFLRMVCANGFEGLGVDVSEAALAAARSSTTDPRVTYQLADVCAKEPVSLGRHDLCLDGRLSHWIVEKDERRMFFSNVRGSLKPGGILVLMAMCGPVDTDALARLYPGQCVRDGILYEPTADEGRTTSIIELDGRRYSAQSYVPHWESLLAELEREGFEPLLVRYARHTPDEPVSSVNVAARILPAPSRV